MRRAVILAAAWLLCAGFFGCGGVRLGFEVGAETALGSMHAISASIQEAVVAANKLPAGEPGHITKEQGRSIAACNRAVNDALDRADAAAEEQASGQLRESELVAWMVRAAQLMVHDCDPGDGLPPDGGLITRAASLGVETDQDRLAVVRRVAERGQQ